MAAQGKLENKVRDRRRSASTGQRKSKDEHLLELVVRQTDARRKVGGVVVGTLQGLRKSGDPLVDFPTNSARGPLLARSTIALGSNDIGGEVVLLFEEGNPRKPIVIGLINQKGRERGGAAQPSPEINQKPHDVELDGERLVLTAQKEIVLRCGKATITLTRAGKVLIRGAYLLNRSSGVNRIKGGAVQIN